MKPSRISAYVAVVSARYRALLQYRAAAIAGFVTQLFWGALKIMVLSAFFAVASGPQPMSLVAVVSYVWLGQALLGMLPWNIDKELEQLIREGGVAYELTRPVDLYWFWFARTIALRTATTTLRSLPMIGFAMVLLPLAGFDDWSLQPPAGWLAGFGFLLSLLAALGLACAITMLMHVVLVLTVSGEGINRLMPPIVMVLSGMVIPLPLYPDFLQPFLDAQPFRGLVDVPFRLYSGDIPFAALPANLAHQLAWSIGFILSGRWLLQRCVRRLVTAGG